MAGLTGPDAAGSVRLPGRCGRSLPCARGDEGARDSRNIRHIYLDNNRHFIVNYGDRYRHGEPIASGFVESAVNQVISKRFVKRQQMAWRPRHAHNLLQIRTAVLNNQLRSYVERWYPSISRVEDHRLAA